MRCWRRSSGPAAGSGDPLGEAVRLHRRRRRQRVPRRIRSASGRDGDGPRASHHRPAGKSRHADHRRGARLLPRRRLRDRARLQVSHRHRRRTLRLSGGDARVASGPRRHGSLHPPDQSAAGDDLDADRPHHRCAARQGAGRGRCGDARAARAQRRAGRGQRQARSRQAGCAVEAPVCGTTAQRACDAHAEGSGQGRAGRTLSRALRADRPVGRARRRPRGDAVGGAGLVRPVDGDADGAEPHPRVLPARADEVARRRRQRHQACACDRRRRDGRRHRRLVRAARSSRDPGRHEGRADRRRRETGRRALRQDHAQADRPARRAGPAGARHERGGRAQRRPHHRGGAGKARAEAEGLCRHRAAHEAGRDPCDQHVQHSAAGSAHRR